SLASSAAGPASPARGSCRPWACRRRGHLRLRVLRSKLRSLRARGGRDSAPRPVRRRRRDRRAPVDARLPARVAERLAASDGVGRAHVPRSRHLPAGVLPQLVADPPALTPGVPAAGVPVLTLWAAARGAGADAGSRRPAAAPATDAVGPPAARLP